MITIGGAKIWAQVSTQTPGTEKWVVTQNTKINKHTTEYTYYASSNVSILFGANETWEAAVQRIEGDDTYYIRSQGNPGCATEVTDETGNQNLTYTTIPNRGNYYHLHFYVGGTFTLRFCYSAKNTKKKLYSVFSQNNTIDIANNFTATIENVQYKVVTNTDSKGTDKYISVPITGADTNGSPIIKAGTLSFTANAGEDYYLWITKTEEFSFGGFEFQVDPAYIFTPWQPYVHEQIEQGKDPKTITDNESAPTGVDNISFMYGGWLNHPNAIIAATWNGTKWGLEDNGTAKNNYKIDNKDYTDKWTEAIKERELTTLDGYDNYTAGCGNAPTDEYGNTYAVPSNVSVSSIPCRGTYYKFEPEKDGFLTVYVRQSNSNNPMYMVDEGGQPQESVDYLAGQDGATITKGDDNSYTANMLTACRYGFNIKAGKTYVLFQNNESLGLYGFTFGADETESSTVEIVQANGYTYEAKDNATVTLTQALKSDQWNAICLPFSMTEKQVRETFGADTRIAEFKNIENSKAKFGMHYYQLITAGKPCLIKPSGTRTIPEGITLENNQYYIQGVTLNAESPAEISDPNNNGFSFVGTYTTQSMPVNSHFLGANDGKLYYITKTKNIGGLKAYFKPNTPEATNVKLSVGFDNNIITGIHEITNDIVKDQKVKKIYNINGQIVGTTDNMPQLNKGIYIINGKKHIIK